MVLDPWVSPLFRERLTGVVLDRLTHRRQILEMKRPSYRLNEAEEGSKGKTKVSE